MTMNSEKYFGIGTIVGIFSGLAAFIIIWGFCSLHYGILFGFGFGWIPASIAAYITYGFTKVLWGLFAVLLVLLTIAVTGVLGHYSPQFGELVAYGAYAVFFYSCYKYLRYAFRSRAPRIKVVT